MATLRRALLALLTAVSISATSDEIGVWESAPEPSPPPSPPPPRSPPPLPLEPALINGDAIRHEASAEGGRSKRELWPDRRRDAITTPRGTGPSDVWTVAGAVAVLVLLAGVVGLILGTLWPTKQRRRSTQLRYSNESGTVELEPV
mmetsp:Transcript_41110/g.95233  ORF Transcript_41110/g.95233 Transcript_41110/m.95233 type:complete len:146 (+) Transcript_41110:179-616(+)